MLRFLLKNPLQLFRAKDQTLLRLLHKPISTTLIEEVPNCNYSQKSLTVSYLINSCGLSPQSARSASKVITIKSTKKPDSILVLLKSQGFTDTQIVELVTKLPKLLLSKWDKSIKPKFDYFTSVGYSGAALTTLIVSNPQILSVSLHKKLKPNFELVRSILSTKQQLAVALRRSSSWLLTIKLETNFMPNVRKLQSCGVPLPNVARLATMNPRALMKTAMQFNMIVESIKKIGFNPLSTMFVEGVSVMAGIPSPKWETKVAVYKSLGWSEAEIVSAFTKQPLCMLLSEDKIRRSMDFFANKMHWGPSFVAARPVILKMSLEKRVIPRCLVMRVLASKGLVNKQLGAATFLMMSDMTFVDKYMTKYLDQVPEVVKVYDGKMQLQ